MTKPIIIPLDYEQLQPWFNILRHVNRTIVCGSNQWLEIGVFIDREGKPQFWEVQDPRYLSPKNRNIVVED